VLTSVTWDLGPLVTAVGKAVEDGSWKSENWSLGVAAGSINLADFHGLDSNVDPAVLKAVEDKIAAIKDGSFEVPLDTSEVQ
jgi:basic membrane protein A and related proteins